MNFGDSPLPPPQRFPDDTRRQWSREYALRIQEAQDLSKHLQGEDELARQLKNMIGQMQVLGNPIFLSNPQELDKLQSGIINEFHQFEKQLSKNL